MQTGPVAVRADATEGGILRSALVTYGRNSDVVKEAAKNGKLSRKVVNELQLDLIERGKEEGYTQAEGEGKDGKGSRV